MKIFGFDLSKRRAPEPRSPEARTHEVHPGEQPPVFHSAQLRARSFRPGMWVMRRGEWARAGILRGLTAEGIAHVTLVQEDGTNFMDVHTLASSLRQAALEDIPASRITRPVEEFIAMGYLRKA